MALLCFLLDLRTLPPSLLRDLKQSLLQLANLYAVLPARRKEEREPPEEEEISPLPDRIGLCYLHRNRALLSDEQLKIAYSPRGMFNLRDFHQSVSNLPMDCFLLEPGDLDVTAKVDQDISLSKLMSNETLYSWGGKDILKKVIYVGSSSITNSDGLRKTLMDAAEQCISVEFIALEQDQYHGFSENLEHLVHTISDLENCILRTYVPNTSVFCGLVKRWFLDLKTDVEEPLQAIFHFKDNILGSTNQIFCNLSASYNHILDGFRYCQACRCHGHPVRNTAGNKTKRFFCPVTNHELGACELIENVIKVGVQTVLFMPSFQSFPELRRIIDPISFNIIERTNLATLDEGIIVGTSYVVTPAACPEIEAISDDFDKTELNGQLFHGLCRALSHFDQGLVCSSTCDTGNMKDVAFQCFYVLHPSDRGTMLLRRLAASEEIWPIPEIISSSDLTLPKEIENSIQAAVSKLEVKDYNPLLHEKGFHLKLNLLVKESLQFGSFLAEKIERSSKFTTAFECEVFSPVKPSTTEVSQEGIQSNSKKEEHTSIVEDLKELVLINDVKENVSPTFIAKPKFEDLNLSSHGRPMDEKTSRILERLEAPKQKTPQQKSMGTLPIVTSNVVDASVKRPLDATISSPNISQPMKPSFQRLKRKQRSLSCRHS